MPTLDDQAIINLLKAYADHGIAELARQEEKLNPVYELVSKNFVYDKSTEILSDEQAEELINYQGVHDVATPLPRPFEDSLVQACYDIGVKVVEFARDDIVEINKLLEVAKYLHPLLSRDDRTIDTGWDLGEYLDWYFGEGVTPEKRVKYAVELIDNWEMANLHGSKEV